MPIVIHSGTVCFKKLVIFVKVAFSDFKNTITIATTIMIELLCATNLNGCNLDLRNSVESIEFYKTWITIIFTCRISRSKSAKKCLWTWTQILPLICSHAHCVWKPYKISRLCSFNSNIEIEREWQICFTIHLGIKNMLKQPIIAIISKSAQTSRLNQRWT